MNNIQMNNIQNTSTLILQHDHGLETKELNRIFSVVKKVIILDGDHYDVVKARHGKSTKKGHISFLTKELQH